MCLSLNWTSFFIIIKNSSILCTKKRIDCYIYQFQKATQLQATLYTNKDLNTNFLFSYRVYILFKAKIEIQEVNYKSITIITKQDSYFPININSKTRAHSTHTHKSIYIYMSHFPHCIFDLSCIILITDGTLAIESV